MCHDQICKDLWRDKRLWWSDQFWSTKHCSSKECSKAVLNQTCVVFNFNAQDCEERTCDLLLNMCVLLQNTNSIPIWSQKYTFRYYTLKLNMFCIIIIGWKILNQGGPIGQLFPKIRFEGCLYLSAQTEDKWSKRACQPFSLKASWFIYCSSWKKCYAGLSLTFHAAAVSCSWAFSPSCSSAILSEATSASSVATKSVPSTAEFDPVWLWRWWLVIYCKNIFCKFKTWLRHLRS